jgi:flavin reductase (DIM6/NTAB) family NADH-FMN oxidoreductase RutF
MQRVDFDSFTTKQVYSFLMGAIVPRPIALVTSMDPDGRVNAAPFSSFICLAVDPAIIAVCVGEGGGRIKDTVLNIEATGEFVCNCVNEAMAPQVQICGEAFPTGTNELEQAGFDALPSEKVRPPRVAVAPIQFECVLDKIVEYGNVPDKLISGRVVAVHVADGILDGHRLDVAGWRPLGRVVGRRYVWLGEFIDA